MTKRMIITIGRQFGSGGKEIAFKLSKRLGISCYDKELLGLAAKDSGIAQQLFETHDEKSANSFLFSLVMDTYYTGYSTPAFVDMPINQKVFLAQFDTIKKIAENESCIIVGRCADYVLENDSDLTSIFIHSPLEKRIKRIALTEKMSEEQAKDEIQKMDKNRSSYYNYYTSKKWSEVDSYNLSIDSGLLGIDETVDVLESYINKRYK